MPSTTTTGPRDRPSRTSALRRTALALALPATALIAACGSDGDPPATAFTSPGIVRLEITSREPTFEGRSFGAVGTYEKLRGKAYGELDPRDPRNAVITDLQFAPRNARGNIEYSMDVYLLKPTDMARGNKKLFMEVNNRGAKLFGSFNGSAGGNDPTTAADAGNAFLMNQGYTMAWSGWDPSAPSGGNSLTVTLPVARNADGSSITGPSYEYLSFDNGTTLTAALSYDTVARTGSSAQLTVRARLTDTPVVVPASGWEFATDRSIRLLPAGTAFTQGAIYEFTYTARDPVVGGIGFAATRDFVAFLRNGGAAQADAPNPVAGQITRVLAHTISQPGRYMNDFVSLGFNQDERGARVFDGVQNWIAAGTGVALNVRFSQPARTERNRMSHLYPEAPFPFAYAPLLDTISGRTDGRNVRCLATNTCPKVMMANSSNEYWVKAASLLHTDTLGRDIADPDNVRFYLFSGMEHTVAGSPANSPGICALPRNTTDAAPALRALFVALDQWVDGTAPPPSAVPRVADGTAVFSQATGIAADAANGVGTVPQAALGWPTIPGVTYTGLVTRRNVLDFGPNFASGVIDTYPPRVTGQTYPSFVSKVDADGNEVAGIRLPPVAAPIATTTGWALRAPAFGGPDGCESFGQRIPFATTAAQRTASGDPRLSLEERYVNGAGYVAAVTQVANALATRRLLLQDDVAKYIAAAQAANVLP